MSKWIAHVKAYAAKHKMTYGAALKHPDCKATYHKMKGMC